jgi:hypothetical protein
MIRDGISPPGKKALPVGSPSRNGVKINVSIKFDLSFT